MYIITGGAGFMGSALIWELNKAGIENILVVDNLATSEKWKNLVTLRYTDYIHRDTFIESVRKHSLNYYASNIQGIVHLGACSSTTEKDADFLMANNFHYSRDLCSNALQYGIRYIQASSAATYGDGSLGFEDNTNDLLTLRPLNMYGYSKHLFDLWLQRNSLLHKVASLKFFNVYGPNEYHKDSMRSVVCKAYGEILENQCLKLFKSNTPQYNHGGQMRDFVYIKDCTRIMFWLLTNSHANGIFNVGTGIARTWNDLALAIFSSMNIKQNIQYIDMPELLLGKYQNYTEACMDKLLATGCPPCQYSIEEGVKDYVQNYLQHHAYLTP